jgi:hypothetical protein
MLPVGFEATFSAGERPQAAISGLKGLIFIFLDSKLEDKIFLTG